MNTIERRMAGMNVKGHIVSMPIEALVALLRASLYEALENGFDAKEDQ